MQLRLLSWFFITLNFMEYIGSQHASRVRRQGRMHPNVSQGCQGGCATCSDYNGCLSCKPRLFFVLERIGMKQIGVCLSSCPSGYYGTRYPDINKCAKCKADCETCFTRNFCTKCKSGFYLYSGKCLEKCPDGLEANNHTMECASIVHCEASEWSPWSPCTKKGKTCGFKRGNEIRVREIVQHPSARGNPCPATSESRKCIVQRKRCQKEGKGMPIILAITVLWPLSHPDLFVIALAEQRGLILPSTSGLQSPSVGERPQHCLASKGHSTWFCPVIKNASRTAPPHEPACQPYSPSQDLVDAIQHG
ncbi:R-spondin-3 isoform X3 [Cygnus atratus]|nr:R-spondin-3 isoform X3 [Cygnus atratus]